jgi:hypothetical protein
VLSFKAVRGEYGSGKTFFTRWLQERAMARGFAVAEVQVSETETPLHRLGDRVSPADRATADERHSRGRVARSWRAGFSPSNRTCSRREVDENNDARH